MEITEREVKKEVYKFNSRLSEQICPVTNGAILKENSQGKIDKD